MAEAAVLFEAEGLVKKYQKLIWGGVLFVILGMVVVVGVFVYFDQQGAYNDDAPEALFPLLPFLLMFIPAYGGRIFKQGLDERKRYKRTGLNGLKFDGQGISGPALLLEGVFRHELSEKKKGDFSFKWDEIQTFILEPMRGSKSYGSPPYFKITFKDKDESANNSCFIMRECFEADEAEIVKTVKKALGKERVVNNDPV